MSELHRVLGRTSARRTFKSTVDAWLLPTQRVGVEIETEGVKNGKDELDKELSMWEYKHDGSLRDNGKEFTTIGDGLFGDDLLVALNQYYSAASKYLWTSSDRTSVHIHLDVSEMNPSVDFFILCILYAYFEKALFRFVGNERETSTFCLPWHKAQKSLNMVSRVCKTATEEENVALVAAINVYQEHEKYSALNIGSLVKYGTIEFRHLANELNQERVMIWINLIMSLKEASKHYAVKYETADKFLEMLLTHNPRLLLEETFGALAEKHLYYAGIEQSLQSSVKVIYNLVYLGDFTLKWESGLEEKATRNSPFNKFLKKQDKLIKGES